MEFEQDDGSPFRGPGFFGLVDMMLAITMVLLITSSLALLGLKAQNEKILAGANASGKVLVEPGEKRIIIPNELNGNIFFSSGSADVRSEFLPILEGFVADVEKGIYEDGYSYVQVEGHTDDVLLRARSPFRDNWELGAARALAVLRYLAARDLPVGTLSAVSYGDSRPKVPNSTEEGRRKNRRIELVLLKDLRGGEGIEH